MGNRDLFFKRRIITPNIYSEAPVFLCVFLCWCYLVTKERVCIKGWRRKDLLGSTFSLRNAAPPQP